MEQVHVRYLGHACFKLSCSGTDIVLDPYQDGYVPGYLPVRETAHFVFCSHDHDDHNGTETVTLRTGEGSVPFSMEELVTHHDDCEGAKRGLNMVRIFTFGTVRVAHLGDLGRPLTPEEREKLFGVDCLFVPVGGFYTIDADTAFTIVEQINPRVVVPMHYSAPSFGYEVIAPVSSFTDKYSNVIHGGSEFILTADTPSQVLVLKPALAQG